MGRKVARRRNRVLAVAAPVASRVRANHRAARTRSISRTNLGARRCEAALLSVVAEGAFECAGGVGQRLWAPVNHAKGHETNAIAAAVANIILHEHRADFGANDRSGGTRFGTASFFAMLANIRKEDPAKRGLLRLVLTNECEPTIWPLFAGLARQT